MWYISIAESSPLKVVYSIIVADKAQKSIFAAMFSEEWLYCRKHF